MKSIEHFAYPLPYRSELRSQGTYLWKTNTELEMKIEYMFMHPSLPKDNVKLFKQVKSDGSKMLVRDMALIAVKATEYFMNNPQQFGGKYENVMMQIVVLMWKTVFKHTAYQKNTITKYYAAKLKTLAIDNGVFDKLLTTVANKEWITVESVTDMVKERDNLPEVMYNDKWKKVNRDKRARVSLGTHEGGKEFEYLCKLGENEIGSLL